MSLVLSETDLVRAAQRGDEHAFGVLVRRYQGPVYRACARYLHGPEAEDAAQEAFLKAFRNFDRFDPERPLLPWLVTIARRNCLDRLRKKQPEAVEDVDQRAVDPHASPERVAGDRQLLGRMEEALEGLADGPRQAILLYHVEGMKYRDIAEALEVPQGTVMTWLHRGRNQLKQAVMGGGRTPSPGTRGGDAQ